MKRLKHFKYLLLIVVFLPVLLLTCKKENKSAATFPDQASDAVESALEQEPSVTDSLNNILLPNGSRLMDFELEYDLAWLKANSNLLPSNYAKQVSVNFNPVKSTARALVTADQVIVGPQAIRNQIISRAQIEANFLVTHSNFDYLLKNKQNPAQLNGLAYVYGDRHYGTITRSSGLCTDMLYGLDCSGMVIDEFNKAGIPLADNNTAATLSQKTTWEAAFKSAGADYRNLDVQVFTSGQMPLNQIKTGDIIYYYEGSKVDHIGAALQDTIRKKLLFFQSNGYSSDLSTGKRPHYCYQNYDSNHGPRGVNLFSAASWGFTDYGVVRIIANISGKWKALIRCDGATFDAIQLELDFPASTGGAFTAKGSGTDYTQEPIQVAVTGNYDINNNMLSGTINYTFPNEPQEQREDSFSSSLNFDSTRYTALTKVIDNGGCNALISLVNLQSTTVTTANKTLAKSMPNTTNCKCSIGRRNH